MNRKITISVVIILAIIAGIIFLVARNRTTVSPADVETNGIILFYGDGCPHCANVDQYIMDNGVEEKVQFIKLEVFNNENNAALIVSLAKKCGIDTETLGVPFLWDGMVSKCYSGDQDIIQFFKNKIEA